MCSCTYRSQPLWEWTGNIIFAAVILPAYFLARFHYISWILAALWASFVIALSYVLFPYVTPFVLAEKAQESDTKPSA
jgi:hypothetical protein